MRYKLKVFVYNNDDTIDFIDFRYEKDYEYLPSLSNGDVIHDGGFTFTLAYCKYNVDTNTLEYCAKSTTFECGNLEEIGFTKYFTDMKKQRAVSTNKTKETIVQ